MHPYLNAIGPFALTALADIFGCYTFYLWRRLKKSPLWLVLGLASLVLFAWLLTVHSTAACRTCATYGRIYIAASLAWLKFVERQSPDRWDVLGALFCLAAAAIILFPHLKTSDTN